MGVLLSVALGFLTAKRALLSRHGLVSHWSSTHSEWWSVVRCGYVATTPQKKEPQAALDPRQLTWSKPGVQFDLFKGSQPLYAGAWRARREKRELNAAGDDAPCKYTKLDLQPVIL